MKSASHTAACPSPRSVPSRTLASTAKMPSICLGTLGPDHASHEAFADAMKYAASIGYRHFDCASVYGNEDSIGRVFQEVFRGELRRDEVWITSKPWNERLRLRLAQSDYCAENGDQWCPQNPGKTQRLQILGQGVDVQWVQNDGARRVEVPADLPSNIGFIPKVDFA